MRGAYGAVNLRTNSASSSMCWCRAPPKPALKQWRLLVPTSSVRWRAEMGRVCSVHSILLLAAVGLSRVACYSHEGSRRCRHAQSLGVVALLEAHGLAVGASAVPMQWQWTSIAVTWSACAEARLCASRCCALPYGLLSDWPYARWGWLQCGHSPVAHAPAEMTGCTAAQCSGSLVASELCEHQERAQ